MRMFNEKGKFVKDCDCICHHIYKHCACECWEKKLVSEDVTAFLAYEEKQKRKRIKK